MPKAPYKLFGSEFWEAENEGTFDKVPHISRLFHPFYPKTNETHGFTFANNILSNRYSLKNWKHACFI